MAASSRQFARPKAPRVHGKGPRVSSARTTKYPKMVHLVGTHFTLVDPQAAALAMEQFITT